MKVSAAATGPRSLEWRQQAAEVLMRIERRMRVARAFGGASLLPVLVTMVIVAAPALGYGQGGQTPAGAPAQGSAPTPGVQPDGPGLGKGGTGVLYVDGKEVTRNSMEHGTPITFPEDETFDIGQDTRTGVALLEYRYDVPFKFTGKIDKLTFKLEPPKP
jgi:hypothetical protein